MKHILLSIILIGFFGSCNNKTKETSSSEENKVVSVNQESILTENKEPENEKFIEFFETFMYDGNFQKERVEFPIIVDSITINSAQEWTRLLFYLNDSYIPILHFDTTTYFAKDIEELKIEMSILNFLNSESRNYNFEKINNLWYLANINTNPIEECSDYEFVEFLMDFSSDSVYQINHTMFPLDYHYLDYDNDYEDLYKKLELEEWTHIELDASSEDLMMLNVDKTNYRTLFFRGVENGIADIFTFEKINDEWFLIKLEFYST